MAGSQHAHGVRDDEIRRILTTANPWWRASAAGGDVSAWTGSHRALRGAVDIASLGDLKPGLIASQGGNTRARTMMSKPRTSRRTRKLLSADGLRRVRRRPRSPAAGWAVAEYREVTEKGKQADFHFIREDSSAGWSHKPTSLHAPEAAPGGPPELYQAADGRPYKLVRWWWVDPSRVVRKPPEGWHDPTFTPR